MIMDFSLFIIMFVGYSIESILAKNIEIMGARDN
jgi:hypothetical protein